MAWTAKVVGSRSDPGNPAQVFVIGEFENAQGRKFSREFKIPPGSSGDDIQSLMVNEANAYGAAEEAAQAAVEASTVIVSTPRVVTNFQARAALMQIPAGEATLFDAVDAHCKAEGGLALQAWEYANNFYRDGALVTTLAPAFGLSPAQVDDLFRAAASIEA